jgi:signal transduction histidine kinase/CheY-like chemotaxis protein
MGGAPKTLHEIRSEACNVILIALTALAIPAAATSLLRGLEQGWQPVMGVHIALVLILIWASLRRRHLSLFIRAGVVTGVPFVIALGGLLAYGRGTGVVMFFVSSCVLAGCFFNRRAALGVVALSVAALLTIYASHFFGVLDLPVSPSAYDMSPLSWLALSAGFVAAGVAPIIGLSALLESLEAERKRADEAVKVRSDFLAHMSHELRTPMAGLIGMAEALRGTRLEDQQQTLVTNLLRAGRNLLSVLNDLLDFSKFEGGNVPIERRRFAISETIKDTCGVFETRAAQKGIKLAVELPPHLQDDVIGDSHRLSHVLSNLIDNAIKFTEQGTITVRADQETGGGGALILECSVIDTGIGLSAAQIAQIFEPFTQADMSISRKYGGSGLGLAICRKLMEAMGGEITAASRPGSGSTFTIRLPLVPQVPPPAATHTVQPPLTAPPEARRRNPDKALRLLVAEDDANMQVLVDIMLPRMGYVVTVVRDGAAAVEAAGAQSYDCIIMDMHMPVMDGPEAMRTIHQAEALRGTPRTPMIALTADLIPEHVRAFLAAGADAVVGKPVDWGALEARIQQLTAHAA